MVLSWGKRSSNSVSPEQEEDMSMDEIMASIRRYVSQEQPPHGKEGEGDHVPHLTTTNDTDVLSFAFDETTKRGISDQDTHKTVQNDPITTTNMDHFSHVLCETLPEVNKADHCHNKEEGVFSETTVSLTSQAFSRLVEATSMAEAHSHPSQKAIQSEITVSASLPLDQLITQLARPIIQTWVDQNLPTMVEKMINEEITRITRKIYPS